MYNTNIKRAEKNDLTLILELQKKSFNEVAKILNNFNIQPLQQTLEEIEKELNDGIILKYELKTGEIIGSVRANITEHNICYIGKLIVDPEYQNRGIGQMLMLEIEKYFSNCSKFYLFTGTKTPNTLHVYKKMGYVVTSIQQVSGVEAYVMEKTKQYRFATENDIALILDFIKGLADYEKMSDEVVATEESLRETLFQKKYAEIIFALDEGIEVGFALFFHTYSTFLAKPCIYLEDLFVKPEYRGKGHGKSLLTSLAKIAVERDCGRFEWCCLDWNQPSIDFYCSLGARQLNDRRVFRIDGKALKELSENLQSAIDKSKMRK